MNVPTDVLLEVFFHLIPRRVEIKTNKKSAATISESSSYTLLACSLVSKSWHDPAMQCLWRIVYIQHEKHAEMILKSIKVL
jgi:hypothetical protein